MAHCLCYALALALLARNVASETCVGVAGSVDTCFDELLACHGADKLIIRLDSTASTYANGDSYVMLSEGWTTDFVVMPNVNVVAFQKGAGVEYLLDATALVNKTADGIRVGLPTAATDNWTPGAAQVGFCTNRIANPTCTRVEITEGSDPWEIVEFDRDESQNGGSMAIFSPNPSMEGAYFWSRGSALEDYVTGGCDGECDGTEILSWPLAGKYFCDLCCSFEAYTMCVDEPSLLTGDYAFPAGTTCVDASFF